MRKWLSAATAVCGLALAAAPATVPTTRSAATRPVATPPGTQPAGHVPMALPIGPPTTQPSGWVDGVYRLPLTVGWQLVDPRDGRAMPAIVPGDVHLDLLRAGRIADPLYGTNEATLGWIGKLPWTYRTTFAVPAEVLDQPRVELVLDGVDTDATVTLNGHDLGHCADMFLDYRFDAKPWLKPDGNRLVVAFAVPGPQATSRKQATEYGWDFAPALVTVGLYRPARIEAGPARRIDFVAVHQEHADGKVTLHLSTGDGRPIQSQLTYAGEVVAGGTDTLAVEQPKLWWPAGMGGQPLYDLTVTAADGPSNVYHRRIGLRTVVLDRHDEPTPPRSQTFRFVVNGRPMFAKGANLVPPHALAGAETPAGDRALVDAAVVANMNVLRVWAGGVVPLDAFYDRADERGLLLWQEFPFAAYADSPAYRSALAADCAYQAKRLASHPCVGLWCGNDEGELLHRTNANLRPAQFDLARARSLLYITQRLMPDLLAGIDPDASWLPSSPHAPYGVLLPADDNLAGDLHEWAVWRGDAGPHEYEQRRPRFVSAFGFQSLASADLARRFCPPDELNVVDSPTMTLRQKAGGRAANGRFAAYAARSFRPAKDFDALVYQTQLLQAASNSVGVRLWRRLSPHCMGSLIWQLNDTWPGTSWAMVDFDGRWKPAMYQARRDYAPAIVEATVPPEARGRDLAGFKDKHRPVRLTVVSDVVVDRPAAVAWAVCRVADGSTVRAGRADVKLAPLSPVTAADLDLTDVCAAEGDAKLYLRYALAVDGRPVSHDTFWFVEPKDVDLPRAAVAVTATAVGPRTFRLTFASPAVQYRYGFDLPGQAGPASDDAFDLYPGEPVPVDVRTTADRTAEQVRAAVVGRSLADTYR